MSSTLTIRRSSRRSGRSPYVIADVQPGKRLILRRNPDYWSQDLPVQRGLFNFDEIEIDYYRDADSSFEAFKAGLCDFRRETDAGRWMSSYDFPAVRDGRTVKESLAYGLPKGMEKFAFNTRAGRCCPAFECAKRSA